VIDRTGIAEETSKGNAAALAFSDIMPLASPKILLKAPKWLLDPLGPLTIRPSYLPRLAPWLWQFWKASLPSRFRCLGHDPDGADAACRNRDDGAGRPCRHCRDGAP
jgi:hypothetical protein